MNNVIPKVNLSSADRFRSAARLRDGSTRYASAMSGPDYAAFKNGWWELTRNLQRMKEFLKSAGEESEEKGKGKEKKRGPKKQK
jgi:hypothetical protein